MSLRPGFLTDPDSYMKQMAQLKALIPRVLCHDQSAKGLRCPIHGYHCFVYFVAGGVPAQYVCAHCWDSVSDDTVVLGKVGAA